MTRIRDIRLAYSDPKLRRSLAQYNDRPEKAPREILSKYRINSLTLENLERGNMTFAFDKSATPKYVPVKMNNAFADEILFSSRNEDISTNASACSSYILFCEKARILSAVHVYASHFNDLRFHKEMLLYAYANLKKLAPENPISAYISGMGVFHDPACTPSRIRLMDMIRPNLLSIVRELLSRGVQIKVIDVGDPYCKQIFSPKTGKYMTYLNPVHKLQELNYLCLTATDTSAYANVLIHKYDA